MACISEPALGLCCFWVCDFSPRGTQGWPDATAPWPAPRKCCSGRMDPIIKQKMSAENIPALTDAVWGGRVSGGGGGWQEQGPQVTQESWGCTAHVPDSQATLLLLQRGHTFPTSQKHTVSKGCEDIACVVKPFNYLVLPSSHSQYPPPIPTQRSSLLGSLP